MKSKDHNPKTHKQGGCPDDDKNHQPDDDNNTKTHKARGESSAHEGNSKIAHMQRMKSKETTNHGRERQIRTGSKIVYDGQPVWKQRPIPVPSADVFLAQLKMKKLKGKPHV